eukprot:TRINITY_DN648_c0_g1_i1.p1 TRINITY_DN648_c0_g1~~TRINITY_DN648_c0_g1_i1.p1  ORF type:complete len:291 (-),score=108.06 TRINITY_DN648_c0_g1_i1:32-904(-)
MSLNPKDEGKFNDLCNKTYKEQGIWFLNAYWNKFAEKEAQNIFDYVQKMGELDQEKKAAGSQLDELNAHRFLEKCDKTLTVVTLRQKLQAAGIDKNTKRKYIPLTHFLVIHYNVNPSELANASQGDNQEEVERAQQLLEQAQTACTEAQRTAEAARQAQAELEAAKRELKAQEDAFNNRTAELQAKSTQGGAVQMNKAKNELAQHLSSDPLPLRKAKITNEAAVKKAEKASAAAEAALADATRKLQEAEAYLQEVSSRSGSAKGALWWIDKELQEAKKYLPKSRGGTERK